MAYTQLTMSPATIEYLRSLGGSGLHVGILGGMPAATLVMQFVAAIVANHLRYRRRVWITVSIVQRLVMVPLVCGPLVLPQVDASLWIWGFILATATNHALLHFCSPLWLSWMGDYLPRDGLNQFWGIRYRCLQWAAAASLLAGSLFVRYSGWDFRWSFAALLLAGAVFGVCDVLFFLRVEEPPVQPAPQLKLSHVLGAPLSEPGFRSFIAYTCFWNFAAMIGAPFISFYLLSRVGMDLSQLLLLWTCSWVGGAMLAGRMGTWAEQYGNRPVLILCTAFKPLNMVALLLVPLNPSLAFWILMPVFMIDAILNAGIAIASNGFLLQNSPSQNRTMYIAAGTALAGMVGGVTSVTAGAILTLLPRLAADTSSLPLDGFQWVFGLSMIMRWVSVGFALRVQEKSSASTRHVVTQLIGVTPTRLLRFPLGFYRDYRDKHSPDGATPRLTPVEPATGLPSTSRAA